MAKQKLTLVTDNTKVNLGGQSTHTVFSNPPQVITIAQPNLSAYVPKRAEGLFGARTSQDLAIELGKLLAEIEMDTFVIGMYVKDDEDPAESPSALLMGQCRNDWIQRYDQEGFIDIDPRFAHCVRAMSWTTSWQMPAGRAARRVPAPNCETSCDSLCGWLSQRLSPVSPSARQSLRAVTLWRPSIWSSPQLPRPSPAAIASKFVTSAPFW